MTYTPPAHTPYQWKNKPSTDTPLDEAHLEAAEQDLEDYTKTGLVDLATYTDAAVAAAQAAAIAASAQGLTPTAVKTGTYTAAAGDFVPADISGGSFTITLPNAPADKTRIGVKVIKVDGSHANAATVARAGSDVFNLTGGSTSLTLSALFQGVLLQYKASSGIWYVSTADTPIGQANGAASLGTDGKHKTTEIPPSVVRGASVLYLNGPPYNAVAGTDITTALQQAITDLAALSYPGGDIYLDPGVYNINGAQQSGTAFGYSYSGQILYPATAGLTHEFAIGIKCLSHANSANDADTAGYSGVVLVSNATSGSVFDCVPGFTAFGATYGWTGVQPVFENVVIVAPANPQCSGIKATCAFRFRAQGLTFITSNPSAAQTGSGVALALPQTSNSGHVMVDAEINGFPVGVDLTEHVYGSIYIGRCMTAVRASLGGGHNNRVDWDIEECNTVFKTVSPGGMVLTGTLAGENLASDAFAQGPLVDEWASGTVTGQLTLATRASSWGSGFPMGIGHYSGLGLDLINALGTPSLGSPGWKGRHPSDDMTRQVALSTANAPGTSWPTLHPWRVVDGTYTVSSGALKASTTGHVLIPAKDAGVPRVVSATFVTGATNPWCGVLVQNPFSGSGLGANYINWQIFHSDLQLNVNANSNRVHLSSVVTPGNTYTLALELLYVLGVPTLVKCYLNAVLMATYALTPTEQAALAPATAYPYTMDGLLLNDTVTTVTKFSALPVTPEAQPMQSVTATATRTAFHFEETICTSGTFTLTLPAAAAGVLNTIVNTGAGTITVAPPAGTLTNLSGATGNITLTQGQRAQIRSDGTNYQQIS